MKPSNFALASLALLVSLGAGPQSADANEPVSNLELNGDTRQVHWVDGDSFKTVDDQEIVKTRITQFNTLESYGAVHRWGTWTLEELSKIAKTATQVARAGTWDCSFVRDGMTAKKDGYGRNLLRCDDLAIALVSKGLAHVLLFDGEKNEPLLEAQTSAIAKGLGMWAKGVPSALLTSLHSKAEPRKKPEWLPYNRVASTRTGQSLTVAHDRVYDICEEVCMQGSCLLYVPYAQRYGDERAHCLANPETKAPPQ